MPKRRATDADPQKRKGRSVLLIPGSGVRIPVPDDAEGEDRALIQALNADPALLARAERQRARDAAGAPRRTGAEVYGDLGLQPPDEPEPPRRRPGRPATGYNGRILVRVPKSMHREMVERAEAEGVSLNQLVLALLSRGLGQADLTPPP